MLNEHPRARTRELHFNTSKLFLGLRGLQTVRKQAVRAVEKGQFSENELFHGWPLAVDNLQFTLFQERARVWKWVRIAESYKKGFFKRKLHKFLGISDLKIDEFLKQKTPKVINFPSDNRSFFFF